MKKYVIDNSSGKGSMVRVILLTMKLLTILIFTGTMAVSASGYSQKTKIDLQLENSTVGTILKLIESRSEFIFFYDIDLINTRVEKSISVRDANIGTVLEELFGNSNIAYFVDDRQIFLYKKGDINQLENLKGKFRVEVEQPQKKQLSGTVKDSKGLPLPGASVLVKGTTIGTITDIDGNFRLSAPTDAKTLVFSFIGMKSQELPIAGGTAFNVMLAEENVGLEEVVAVGYGVQKKESIVGSIVQTTNEQLKRTGNVTDLKQALTGLLPGVTTITSSGEPGGTGTGNSATSIFIRGRNTWNGGQPLILVDGVERSMDNLDVSEVESISVLKDASATAVFGVKGANGVILITTKRGTISKPKLSFSYNATALSISKVPEKLDSYNALLIKNEIIEREVVLNKPSWADYTPEQIVERYKLPQSPVNAIIYPNVNWKEALFKDISMSHRAALNIQGGTGFVNYFGSVTYLHEGDMFKEYNNNKGYKPNYNFDRFNFRSNLDFKLTSTTNFKVDLAGYFSQKNRNYNWYVTNTETNRAAWASIYLMPPDGYLPQYDDGRWGNSTTKVSSLGNPVESVYNSGILENRAVELNADFTLEQKLDFVTKGLSAKASVFYDNNLITEGGIIDLYSDISNTAEKIIFSELYTGPDQNPNEYTRNIPLQGGTNQFDWVVIPWTIKPETVLSSVKRRMMYQFQINYSRKFGLHNVGATGVFKREEYALGNMFKNYREDWVSRLTYDYDTRYLFEANGAYNGSEKFGPGNRFEFFPSLALGWNVSNEKFFKIDWISRLKLRYSIGVVGDDSDGSRWAYDSQYSYGGAARMSQDIKLTSPYTWYSESVVGNPDIHWEKARKSNYGLEIGLLDNLVSVNYDYFTEDRTDILLSGSSRAIPPYFGVNPPSANLGKVKSKGYEIELKLNKSTSYDLHYWATLSFTHTANKVLEKDDPALLASYLKSEGYPIGQSRTTVRAGFYNNWDEVYASVPTETNDLGKLPGDYNLLDFNADGVIKTSGDVIPYGYSEVPENTCSFSLGADYKGFSLMLQFYGVNNVSRDASLRYFYSQNDVLFKNIVSDSWSKDNQDASSFLPRWKSQGQNIGDYFLCDASYLRLKTAEIAYKFRGDLVKKLGLSTLRIFINGNNLGFWSKLPDDREATWTGESSVVIGTYPTPKRLNLGVELTF